MAGTMDTVDPVSGSIVVDWPLTVIASFRSLPVLVVVSEVWRGPRRTRRCYPVS